MSLVIIFPHRDNTLTMGVDNQRQVRQATPEEVSFAVTGRRVRRPRPGEVKTYVERQRQRQEKKARQKRAREKRKAIGEALARANTDGANIPRKLAVREYKRRNQ